MANEKVVGGYKLVRYNGKDFVLAQVKQVTRGENALLAWRFGDIMKNITLLPLDQSDRAYAYYLKTPRGDFAPAQGVWTIGDVNAAVERFHISKGIKREQSMKRAAHQHDERDALGVEVGDEIAIRDGRGGEWHATVVKLTDGGNVMVRNYRTRSGMQRIPSTAIARITHKANEKKEAV